MEILRTRRICKHCGACACDECKAEGKNNCCRFCKERLETETQELRKEGWVTVE